jgi:hypothetical protein
MKLSHQFKSGGTGGKPISDQVGAGSEGRDEQVKALIPTDVRERVENEVGDMFGNKGSAISSHSRIHDDQVLIIRLQ